MRGPLLKMQSQLQDTVEYQIPLGGELLAANAALGQEIHLAWTSKIFCVACGNATRKSFDQGHCWECFSTLARCDQCIMKPELCHFHEGTCREPEWAKSHCLSTHVVYLSNSSGLKIGITRLSQKITRWIDQGAVQGIALGLVNERLHSGLVESHFRDRLGLKDRTAWQAMLKGEPELLDLDQLKSELIPQWPSEVPVELLPDEKATRIHFPILEYPKKVTSLNLEKNPEIRGTLLGIKGQYLILSTGVINLRKYQGYEIEVLSWS